MSEKEILLDVRDLCTVFQVGKRKTVTAVNGISFQVGAGEILGLVGESGCGKSVTSLSVMQLLKNTSGRVVSGQILLKGKDLLHCTEKEMRCRARQGNLDDFPGAHEFSKPLHAH